ncbi:hypothetical protein D0U04_06585 [Bacillus clarus]|uniref:Uncharacterized protein n=1 Tax=Bacillus clarus TaxID=2338372 RepID=A0A090Z0K9_9BACI|nr:DUF6572 domain-containing protein [Bacillus clarus]KFN04152.1 hypothetical protein DJ93_667 [Bacillus clarus]RFT67755.1 hypothetical protein D0U04_06585 [Bacillus clarus]
MTCYESINNQDMLYFSIVDTLDWEDEEEHISRLYEAINKFRVYVENDERMNQKKRAVELETKFVIQVFAQHECSEYGNEFYELIKDLLQDIGFELKIFMNQKNNSLTYI